MSTKRAQQQQQQCTRQSLMLIGPLISSCFRMQILGPEGQLSSWTFDGFVEVAMLNSDCPQRPLHPLSMPISRDPRGQMLRCCDSASSQSPLSIFRVRNPSRQSNVANQVCVSQPVRYGMWSSFQDAPCRKLAQTLLVPLVGHAAWLPCYLGASSRPNPADHYVRKRSITCAFFFECFVPEKRHNFASCRTMGKVS